MGSPWKEGEIRLEVDNMLFNCFNVKLTLLFYDEFFIYGWVLLVCKYLGIIFSKLNISPKP